jgi:hypothetical protein
MEITLTKRSQLQEHARTLIARGEQTVGAVYIDEERKAPDIRTGKRSDGLFPDATLRRRRKDVRTIRFRDLI